MPLIAIEKPEIMTISYRQTKEDKGYGSCLWARFNFDLKHYSLAIESDCGNYSYGWLPTPRTESFIHLCGRFDKLYLLHKLSSKSVIDEAATFERLKEFLKDYDEEGYENLTEDDLKILEDACVSFDDGHAVVNEIQKALDDTDYSGSCCDYDIACCIVKDYPNDVKRIVDIFHDHIQPVVRKLAEEDKSC